MSFCLHSAKSESPAPCNLRFSHLWERRGGACRPSAEGFRSHLPSYRLQLVSRETWGVIVQKRSVGSCPEVPWRQPPDWKRFRCWCFTPGTEPEWSPWLLTFYQRLFFQQCNISPLFKLVRGRESPRTLNRAVFIHGNVSCSGPRCMASEKNSQKTKKKTNGYLYIWCSVAFMVRAIPASARWPEEDPASLLISSTVKEETSVHLKGPCGLQGSSVCR